MPTIDPNVQFQKTAEDILREGWDFYPNLASGLGLHDYDGRLPDISPAALARRAREVEDGIASLRRIDGDSLDRQNGFDRRLLTLALKKERFELVELRTHENNPVEMLDHIELSNYVKRDYAPLKERVRSLTQALEGVPAFLKTLQDGLNEVAREAELDDLKKELERPGGLDVAKRIEEAVDPTGEITADMDLDKDVYDEMSAAVDELKDATDPGAGDKADKADKAGEAGKDEADKDGEVKAGAVAGSEADSAAEPPKTAHKASG